MNLKKARKFPHTCNKCNLKLLTKIIQCSSTFMRVILNFQIKFHGFAVTSKNGKEI